MQLGLDPGPIDVLGEIQHFDIENQGTNLVGEDHQWRDRDRIGDPHQHHRDRQIDPEVDRQRRRRDHLKRYRHEGHEQADGECPRDGRAIQVPQVWIMDQLAKNLQVLVIANLVRVRQVTLDKFFGHAGVIR